MCVQVLPADCYTIYETRGSGQVMKLVPSLKKAELKKLQELLAEALIVADLFLFDNGFMVARRLRKLLHLVGDLCICAAVAWCTHFRLAYVKS